jgi:hypothetical protein
MLSMLKRNASAAALVVAVIALIVAIGGVAGALPGKNTVNSGDVKKNTLKSVDIKDDAVTGNDVKESTLNIPSSAVKKDTFGGTIIGGSVDVTLPGTTVQKSGNTYTWTFPRSVTGCVPVASGTFSDGIVALLSGTANPNKVVVTGYDATSDHSLIVTCP